VCVCSLRTQQCADRMLVPFFVVLASAFWVGVSV